MTRTTFSTVFRNWALILMLILLVTFVYGQTWSGGWDGSGGSSSGIDKSTYFYDINAPYENAYPLMNPVADVYSIPAAGCRIACLRSEPDSGYDAGVLTSVWRNHRAALATNLFKNRCAWGHQVTDMEILIRRFYGGIPDTITEQLWGDTTVIRGWISLGAFESAYALTQDEYSNAYTSLVGGNREAGGITNYYHSQETFPRVEFRDSVEVWMRSAAGSRFNYYGGVNGMQMRPSQPSVYHKVDGILVPASSLYGRRVHIQERMTIPRVYDTAMLGYTKTGGRKGCVWYTSYTTGPCYTVASNVPWDAGAPYDINFRKFPDATNSYSHLEEDGAFYLGYPGRSGTPIFTQMHGTNSSGAAFVRIKKPNSSLTLASYFPLGSRNAAGHRVTYTMFNIRQSADPSAGGGAFACLTSAVQDCVTYWYMPLVNASDMAEEITGSTLNATYGDGDQCLITTNSKWIVTGSEDGTGGGYNGFYSYNNTSGSFNWQALFAGTYTDISPDSCLWRVSGDSNYIGQPAFAYGVGRLWLSTGDNPGTLPLREGEVFSYASFKYKNVHNAVTQSTLTRKCLATTVYVTEDVNYYPTLALRDTFYASLVNAIDKDRTGLTSTEWASLSRPSRSAAGAAVDSNGVGLGAVTNNIIDWQPLTANYSSSNKQSTSRLFFNFPTDTFKYNVGSNHKVISSVTLEWYAQSRNGTVSTWGTDWIASDTFPVDSSYMAIVRAALQLDNAHATQNLRFLKNDSLGGLKFSAYAYPRGFGKLSVRLADSTLRQGYDTFLATRWATWDVRRIFPQIGSSTTNIVRLDVPNASYPDVSLRPKLIIEYTLAPGNVPDTVAVSFTDDRSGSDWIKDAWTIDGSSSSSSGSSQIRTGTNADGTRLRKGLLSMTQAAKDSMRTGGKRIVSAICSLWVNTVSSLAGDQFKLYTIGDNDSSVVWATAGGDVTGLKRDVTNNKNWPGGRTTGPVTFASPFATYNIDTVAVNNWFVFDITSAIQSMCSTQVADTLRDGIMFELTDNNDASAGGLQTASEEDVSTNANTSQHTDNSRLDPRIHIRYVVP